MTRSIDSDDRRCASARAGDSPALNEGAQIDPHQLVAEVKNRARREGFTLVGIASAEPSANRDYFRQWLADGKQGGMEYLSRRFEERADPRAYLPGARSVICVAMNYYAELEPVPAEDAAHHARVARYCLGTDYHELMKKRLWRVADWLRDTVPGALTKTGVDTAPVMERDLAARAGIGWVGKNTCVIHPQVGSWLLLGEILTTVELPVDEPAVDRCGTCRRCIDACPTDAITEAYQLDARRCISYLTIEHPEPIPEQFQAALGEWLYGCDICQDVCPFNSKAPATEDAALRPRIKTGTVDLREVLSWRAGEASPISGTAMKRVKLPVLQRNAKIIAENLGRRS
jgi:epoxyqueuosine reductase